MVQCENSQTLCSNRRSEVPVLRTNSTKATAAAADAMRQTGVVIQSESVVADAAVVNCLVTFAISLTSPSSWACFPAVVSMPRVAVNKQSNPI